MGAHFFSIFTNDTFLDLRLYQYGWEECSPLHSFGPSVRNHYLFHYVISGCGTLYSNAEDGRDREYALVANQGFLICPGQINTYIASEDQPWKYAWVEFDGLRAEECLSNAGLSRSQPIYQPVNTAQGEKLRDQILYISDHSSASPLHLTGQLYLLLDQLIESSSTRKEKGGKQSRDFYIQEAVSYIRQNYQRNLTVEEVADFCKLNRNYFSRRFKEVIGCTPQEFLIKLRLTTAAELMSSTNDPIKVIAFRCGYPNQLHFSQAFKRFYGLPPREWRQQNKELERK